MAGPDALLRALEAVEEECTSKAVHKAAAETVADGARPFTPVASGRARRSIRASGTKKSGVVRAGGPALPWIPPLHFGDPPPRAQGGYMEPQPFLYDGADTRRDDVEELFFRKLNDALRKQGLT